MKKLIAILMAVALVLCLAACGNDEAANNNNPANNTDTNTDKGPAQDSFSFTYNGTKIALHAPAAPIVEALGQYLDYSESTSCAFDGLDKTYTYSSFGFSTYPIGDKDYISSIWFLDDMVETDEGIAVGSSLAAVQAAFSSAENNNGTFTVTKGHGKLQIKLEDDVVKDILFSATFD